LSEIRREALEQGWVEDSLSLSTIWRWLQEDGLQPWRYQNWLFPRDPDFATKAAPILDLYAKIWEEEPLDFRDFVLCADEKTSIQARNRKHPSMPTLPHERARMEHEYERLGAWAYLAAWDVHNAKLFGRGELRTGIEPFERLVEDVMSQEPYRSARRVFWIVDNGSSHRGEACRQRFAEKWPNTVVVHTPVHASWLNQIEIYFSIVQRKALNPNDFPSLEALQERLLGFQARYEAVAQPFQWRFTRKDLSTLLRKLSDGPRELALAA
jgi:hypothetical protein